jgi:hypothetical protein
MSTGLLSTVIKGNPSGRIQSPGINKIRIDVSRNQWLAMRNHFPSGSQDKIMYEHKILRMVTKIEMIVVQNCSCYFN